MLSGLGHQHETPPSSGSMAIFCPACPQPGVNLPEDWRERYSAYASIQISPFMYFDVFKGMNSYEPSLWMVTFQLSI